MASYALETPPKVAHASPLGQSYFTHHLVETYLQAAITLHNTLHTLVGHMFPIFVITWLAETDKTSIVGTSNSSCLEFYMTQTISSSSSQYLSDYHFKFIDRWCTLGWAEFQKSCIF